MIKLSEFWLDVGLRICLSLTPLLLLFFGILVRQSTLIIITLLLVVFCFLVDFPFLRYRESDQDVIEFEVED